MTELQEIPLFPLHSVLFPRGKLCLQIFERRYLDLVASSLRSDTGFGINLLKDREELARSGRDRIMHNVGTLARIVDWDQLPNGLLGITVEGVRKYRIESCRVGDNDLYIGRVRFSESDTVDKDKISIEEGHSGMTELLQLLGQHPAIQDMNLEIDYENLWELGWRLSELIPVALEIKQELLEIDDPWERIRVLEQAVQFLASED